MTAKLVAIQFDRTTEEYLQRTMSGNEADQLALEQMDAFGDLSQSPALLKNLPAGDYVLILSGEFDRDPATKMHLLKANTGEVMHTAILDLTPIMESALDDSPEFDQIFAQMTGEESEEKLQEAVDAQTDAMNRRRATQLEGLLSPYLENDVDFNVELLDMLDFMTYPLIKNGVSSDVELEEDIMPEITPTYAYNKHTLH